MKKIISKMLIAACIWHFAGCGNSESQPERQSDTTARPIEVTQVVGIGKVEPRSGLRELAIDQAGIVREVFKAEGDSVKKGDLILSVDSDQIALQTENLQIQLKRQNELTAQALASERQLAAELRMAESEWQTSRELAMDGAETEQNVQSLAKDVEVLRAQYQGAKNVTRSNQLAGREITNQIEQNKTNIRTYSLIASDDGVLVSLDAKKGRAVEAFAVLGQLASDEERVIHGEVDELFAHRIKIGDKVTIVKEGSDQQIADGEIIFLSPILQDKSIFYDKPGEVSDRRVRRFKVGFSQDTSILINTKVECIIHL